MENVNKTAEQLLTFYLNEVEYGIDVRQTKEVVEFNGLTHLVGRSEFVRGIINLRNKVIPVIDLKPKFKLEKTEKTLDACIIVLTIDYSGEDMEIGILADSVKEVVYTSQKNIESPPAIGMSIDSDFISGVDKSGDHFTVILDIDKVFNDDELKSVKMSVKEEQ